MRPVWRALLAAVVVLLPSVARPALEELTLERWVMKGVPRLSLIHI